MSKIERDERVWLVLIGVSPVAPRDV